MCSWGGAVTAINSPRCERSRISTMRVHAPTSRQARASRVNPSPGYVRRTTNYHKSAGVTALVLAVCTDTGCTDAA